jgi:SRSO17 transposase
MSAMLERVTDPGTYQAFQHFITHAPWSTERVWRELRAVIPERTGMVILDGTSFPKQGRRSVAVARQYCGTLGKVANCQVAVSAALWTGIRAWMLGAALYVPEEWLTPDARQRARIPASIRFQEKWRLALTLLRQIRAAGFHVTAVLGDAEFGDNATCAARCIDGSCRTRSASRPRSPTSSRCTSSRSSGSARRWLRSALHRSSNTSSTV